MANKSMHISTSFSQKSLGVETIGGMMFFDFDDDTAVISPDEGRTLANELIRQADQVDPPKPSKVRTYAGLGDQARTVLRHMQRAGSISAREAMDDYQITSATLARRICDLEEAGYAIIRRRKTHPITGQRYTRYELTD